MGAELRVLRRRIRSVESTKKITRAQELIAASRIIKAQQRAEAARPYTRALGRPRWRPLRQRPSWTTRCSKASVRHSVRQFSSSPATAGSPALTRRTSSGRARRSPVCWSEQGQEVVPYVVGQKGVTWFRFRGREVAASTPASPDLPSTRRPQDRRRRARGHQHADRRGRRRRDPRGARPISSTW